MSRSAINDLIFGEAKASTEFAYKTNGGKEFKVKMYDPSVRDKGWTLGLQKLQENPSDIFIEVLMRADIRDTETNERLFDNTLKDSIANSDQDLLVKMASDWLGLLNRVKQDEAIKN